MFRDLNSLVPNYCVAQFGENANDIECANLLDYAILAPYVELTMLNFGVTLTNNIEEKFFITVGNKSSPLVENTAAIKSYSCSVGPALTATFEIIDTDGGNFSRIYNQFNVPKCADNNGNKNTNKKGGFVDVSWDWGWIGMDEAGNTRLILASSSKKVPIPNCGNTINVKNNVCYGHVNDVKVSVDSKSGCFRYTFDVTDIAQSIYQVKKVENVFGKEEAKIPLTDAMKQLVTGVCGEVKNNDPDVQFILAKANADGTLDCESFKPKDGGANGPKGVWPALGLAPHDALTEWKNNFVGANGKGSIHAIIQTKPPTLVILTLPDNVDANKVNDANANAKVKQKVNFSKPDVTYIVNGGNNSPVISFDPKFTYIQTAANLGSGGNAGGAVGPPQGVGQGNNDGDPAAAPGQDNKKVAQKSGPQVRIPVRYYDTYNTSPTNVLQQKADAYLAQARTMGVVENLANYSAELTIQGDPVRYASFIDQNCYKPVGIIFINPFQLSKTKNNENSDFDWIAPDVCNGLLSRTMNINAITHNIEGGKYTTKLSLLDMQVSSSQLPLVN